MIATVMMRKWGRLMLHIQTWLGGLAMLAVFYRNVPALRALKRGQFQPNFATYMIWALISLIEAVIILANRGGFGATSMVLSVVFFSYFGVMGLKYAKEQPTNRRFIMAMLGAVVVPLLLTLIHGLTQGELLFILAIVEALAIIPTIQKIKRAPYSESLSCYVWNDISMLLSLLAIHAISFETVFVPLIWVLIMSGCIIYMLVLRSRAPKRQKCAVLD